MSTTKLDVPENKFYVVITGNIQVRNLPRHLTEVNSEEHLEEGIF